MYEETGFQNEDGKMVFYRETDENGQIIIGTSMPPEMIMAWAADLARCGETAVVEECLWTPDGRGFVDIKTTFESSLVRYEKTHNHPAAHSHITVCESRGLVLKHYRR